MSKKKKAQKIINYDKQKRRQNKEGPANNNPHHGARPKAAQQCERSAPQVAHATRIVSLTPLDPIIIRSGRPFDDQAGPDAARFPPPSTLAGCLRTAWARINNQGYSGELLQRSVSGPLLRRGDTWLLPKPADANYFNESDGKTCVRALPKPYPEGCGSDLPAGLTPIQLERPMQGKATAGPAWWAFEDWLAFRRGGEVKPTELDKRGWSPPAGDRRTHVTIDPDRNVADEGKLFQLEGLDLGVAIDNGESALNLLARFAEPIAPCIAHLGGKRRMAALQPQPEDAWPKAPDEWWQSIAAAGGLTLTLVTPALFDAGERPGWVNADTLVGEPPGFPGLQLRLRGMANERWQPQSGWDLEHQQPRATRKLIPAGAVYWFEIIDRLQPADLAPLWLASLCDQEQDRRDGFGLVLPSPWQPNQPSKEA